MNKMWIVAKEVYRKNVKSWSFFWMVFGPIIMFAVILAIIFFITKDRATSSVGNVAVINAQPEIQEVLTVEESGNRVLFDLSEDEAKQALEDGSIDGYLVVNSEDLSQSKYYRKTTSKDINLSPFETALSRYALNERARGFGLNQEQVQEIQNLDVNIDQINVSVDADGNVTEQSKNDPVRTAKTVIAYIVSIVIFMFITGYVGIISQEIAAEKGSRIMEIILSSISATDHFIGKLLGIVLVILTQILAYVMMYVLFMLINNQFNLLTGLGDIDIGYYVGQAGNMIWISLIYAIIGIMIYTAIGGFLGSLVSRTEDVNKVITPIMFTGVAGFYIAMYALASPNSPIVKIGSHFPLFTPFIMPFRLATETVGSTELIISMLVSIIFAILIIWFALVFYRSNVLVYSDKGAINTFKRSFALWKSERATN